MKEIHCKGEEMKLNLKNKIMLAFFSTVLVTSIAYTIVSYTKEKNSLLASKQENLIAMRESKYHEIKNLFENIKKQTEVLSQTPYVIDAMESFNSSVEDYQQFAAEGSSEFVTMKSDVERFYNEVFLEKFKKTNNGKTIDTKELIGTMSPGAIVQQYYHVLQKESGKNLDKTDWSGVHEKFHPLFKRYLDAYGYYDIFLIDNNTGKIVYSVLKQIDFGTSLKTGPFKDSGLASIFHQIKSSKSKEAIFIDMNKYVPSYKAPTAFLGAPIYKQGTRVGTLVMKIPVKKIDAIMTSKKLWSKKGFGKTGESYLVGQDLKMRSISRRFSENPESFFKYKKGMVSDELLDYIRAKDTTVLTAKVENAAVSSALQGDFGISEVKNYYGNEVISAYKNVNILGTNWALVVEKSMTEVLDPVRDLVFTLGIILLVVLCVTFFLSVVIAGRITGPIIKSVELVEGLSQGKLEYQPAQKYQKDETGFMLRSIEKTIDRLKDILNTSHVDWEDVKNQKKRELEALEESKVQKKTGRRSSKRGFIRKRKSDRSPKNCQRFAK